MKTVLFLIIGFSLFSCVHKGRMAGDKAICLDSIVIQKELRFSSLFEKPEIIILDDDTIVGNIDKLLAKDSLLLILDKELNALHVFDRSGEFKYNIGSQGSGPGEYTLLCDFTLDKEGNVYALDFTRQIVYCYSLSGQFFGSSSLNRDEGQSHYIHYNQGDLYTDLHSKSGEDAMMRKVDLKGGQTERKYFSVNVNNEGWRQIQGHSPFCLPLEKELCFSPLYSKDILCLQGDREDIWLKFVTDAWMDKKTLDKIDVNKGETLRYLVESGKVHSLIFLAHVKNDYLFKYQKGYQTYYGLLSASRDSCSIFNGCVDDWVYRAKGDDVHIIPNLITYDEKGVYGCLDMYTMPLFLSLVRSGQVNESLDRILELKNLTENSNPLVFYYPAKE